MLDLNNIKSNVLGVKIMLGERMGVRLASRGCKVGKALQNISLI
jgi:hypothetical protein